MAHSAAPFRSAGPRPEIEAGSWSAGLGCVVARETLGKTLISIPSPAA
ncbi:MAG: hypothetical protein QOG14_1600 [Mycobacterium sp.]|nr:hypothetical protein [Mycobacterium sp.]